MAAMEEAGFESLWAAACRLTSVTDLHELRVVAVETVASLVSCDVVTMHELDPSAVGRTLVVAHPADYRWATIDASEVRGLMAGHPLLHRYLSTGDGTTRRLSDELDLDAFHATELYRRLYGPLGLEFQVALVLSAPTAVVPFIVVCRRDRDFTRAELDRLDAYRLPLGREYLKVLQLDRLRRQLGSVVEVGPAGAVRQPDGVLRGTSDSGQAMVDRWFGRGYLHVDLAAWLVARRDATVGHAIDEPYVINSVEGSLLMRWLGQDGEGDRFEIEERHVPPSVLGSFGLSAREREIVCLLIEGAGTKSIAKRLGCQPATVKKHIESIYHHLGVHDRQSAVRAVLLGVDEQGMR